MEVSNVRKLAVIGRLLFDDLADVGYVAAMKQPIFGKNWWVIPVFIFLVAALTYLDQDGSPAWTIAIRSIL